MSACFRLPELRDLTETHLRAFERGGDKQSLNSAIHYALESLEIPTEDSHLRFNCLHLASRAFLHRFQLSKNQRDLDAALRWGKEAVQSRPQDDPDRLVCLIEVTNALLVRYELMQSAQDLEEAVCWSKELLLLCPEDDPETRVQILWTLTASLRSSFSENDNADELDELIGHYKDLVSLCDEDNPLCAPSYYHLAHACKTRYEGSNDSSHLEDAVNFASSALIMHHEGHPHRRECLDDLGEVMLMQYKITSDPSDVYAAIAMFEEALELCSDSPHDSAYLKATIKLSGALFVRWKDFGDEEAMKRTEKICEHALRGCRRDHSLRPLVISLLENAKTVLRGKEKHSSSTGG